MCINCGLSRESIESSLERLINMSKEEREKITNTAYTKVKHLTWEKNAHEYASVYDSL